MSVHSISTSNKNRSVLITGANSGLGFEAATQLANAGYRKIILACRTEQKAEGARKRLVERVGRDPFETLSVDVSSIASSKRAAKELIDRGESIDQLLLNAGIVPGDTKHMSEDGIELGFASSLIGHHIIANELLEADLIADEGSIIIVSSEGARNDLPAMMGLKLYDFATGTPIEFGDNLHDAMTAFATGKGAVKFEGMRHYGVIKLFSAWWAAEMAERLGGRVSVYAVSPGSSMSTNAARNVEGFKKFLFTKVMPVLGPYLGMDQPVEVAAKRYVDVLLAPKGQFKNGGSYMSKPKKMVGPMVEQTYPHMRDQTRRKAAWQVLEELTGRAQSSKLSATA